MFIGVGGVSFSSLFTGSENPLSESGAWQKNGSNSWQVVKKLSGNAVPSSVNAGGAPSGPPFDDNYVYLSSGTFSSSNYEIKAEVYKGTATSGECELLFCIADTTTTARGYECLCNIGGGVDIVRWEGALNSFTPLSRDGGGGYTDPNGLSDGDWLRATKINNTFTFYYSRAATPTTWNLIGATTNSTFTDGQPGIGFFQRDSGNLDFGFKQVIISAI